MVMSCALCQSNSPLQDSHIIPEFFYAPLYHAIHRFQVVRINALERQGFEQKGTREKLLCKVCEQKLSAWEKYTKEAFCNGMGIKIEQAGELVKLSNLDYKKFRLFLLSLLWRMGVSNSDFFSLVDLGSKHEEILRQALLKEDPLDPLQYPCLLSIVRNNGRLHLDQISQPMHVRNADGNHCYCLVINGMLFLFYVASHSLPAIFAEACINRKNQISIIINEIQKIPILVEYVSDLKNAVVTRSKLGKNNL